MIDNPSQFNTIEDASYMYYQNTGNDTISVDLPNAIVAESAFAECEAKAILLTENSLRNVVYAPSMFNGANITSIPYNDSADGIYALRLNSATNIYYIFNDANIGNGARSIILSATNATIRNATFSSNSLLVHIEDMGKASTLYIARYDSNNKLLDIQSGTVEKEGIYFIELPEVTASYIKLFLWDEMVPLTEAYKYSISSAN